MGGAKDTDRVSAFAIRNAPCCILVPPGLRYLVPRVLNCLFSTRAPPRAPPDALACATEPAPGDLFISNVTQQPPVKPRFPQAWAASGPTTCASVPWFGSSCYLRDWLCISGKKNPEQGGWCMCLPMNKQPNLQSIQVRSNTTSCTTKRKSFFRFINGWVIGWHNNRHARFEWNCL
jgi:hypothetical protein